MTDQEEALLQAIRDANSGAYISTVSPPEVAIRGNRVTITAMYEYVPCTFQTLDAIGKFFNTDRVNLVDQDSTPGCESCDYGSEYVCEFEIGGAP